MNPPSPSLTPESCALEVERNNLLNLFKLTIKALLDSTPAGRLLSNKHTPLLQFLLVLERVLQHGLLPARTASNLTGYSRNFWAALDKMDRMSSQCVEIMQNVRALPDIKTGIGRGRAWIRFAMMQKKLPDYFEILAANRHSLQDVYRDEAIMMDEEAIGMLSGLMVGLNVLEYNFVAKQQDLDNLSTVLDLCPFLRDGNYLHIRRGTQDSAESQLDAEDEDISRNLAQVSSQNSYLEEVNKKTKNQLDEALSKVAQLEKDKIHLSLLIEAGEVKINELSADRDVLLAAEKAREEETRRRLETVESDMQAERETIQVMNKSLDEMNQETQQKLAQEIAHRLEMEKEVGLQASMRAEAEEAVKLLEADMHEKQDSLVSLRQQLQDIKKLNLELYTVGEERQTQLQHKTRLVGELEEKSFRMNKTLNELQTDLRLLERDRNGALDTARTLGVRLGQKDNILSSLETNLAIEREWRTALQSEKEGLVTEIETLRLIKTQRVPELESALDAARKESDKLGVDVLEQQQSLSEMAFKLREQEERLDELREAEDSKMWVDERSVKLCFACDVPFSATIRKHHCRSCGQVFCSNCSGNKAKLPISKDPVRVCNECHTKAANQAGGRASFSG